MSTLGAVKEPAGRVDILQHCLFTLTTEFSHHLVTNTLITRTLLRVEPPTGTAWYWLSAWQVGKEE